MGKAQPDMCPRGISTLQIETDRETKMRVIREEIQQPEYCCLAFTRNYKLLSDLFYSNLLYAQSTISAIILILFVSYIYNAYLYFREKVRNIYNIYNILATLTVF